jgi:hypothetical protein
MKFCMQLDYGGTYELHRKCHFSVRNHKIFKLVIFEVITIIPINLP